MVVRAPTLVEDLEPQGLLVARRRDLGKHRLEHSTPPLIAAMALLAAQLVVQRAELEPQERQEISQECLAAAVAVLVAAEQTQGASGARAACPEAVVVLAGSEQQPAGTQAQAALAAST